MELYFIQVYFIFLNATFMQLSRTQKFISVDFAQ